MTDFPNVKTRRNNRSEAFPRADSQRARTTSPPSLKCSYIRRLQVAVSLLFLFFFDDDDDGVSLFSASEISIGDGTRWLNRPKKLQRTLSPGRYFPRMGLTGKVATPFRSRVNERTQSPARTPQDSRLIALIFFVCRFETSYTPARSQVRKSAPTVKETVGRRGGRGVRGKGSGACKGWIKILRYDNPRETFTLTSLPRYPRRKSIAIFPPRRLFNFQAKHLNRIEQGSTR